MAQLICRYRKGEGVKWLSHLDVKRTLERAMRRARLPLALTRGHNPHPKLSLGPPLAVGVTGEAELLAIHLEPALAPEVVKERLNAQLPLGLEVVEAWVVPGYRRKETFGDVEVAEYRAIITGCAAASAEAMAAGEGEAPSTGSGQGPESRVRELMASRELIVQRGGERPERAVDLRPLILSLHVVESAQGQVELRMRLRTGSHGGARPQEVVSLLGVATEDSLVSYHRTGLYARAQTPAGPAAETRRRWTRSRASPADPRRDRKERS